MPTSCPDCHALHTEGAILCPECGATLRESNTPRRATVAPFPRRIAAVFIDFAFLLLPSLTLAVFLSTPPPQNIRDGVDRGPVGFQLSPAEKDRYLNQAGIHFGGILFSWLFLGFLYYPLFENSKNQATPGKRLLGLVVIDDSPITPRPLSLPRLIARHALRILSSLFCGIPFGLALLNPDKLALHDRLTRTRVALATKKS